MLFSHEKVVVSQFDAGRWFYTTIGGGCAIWYHLYNLKNVKNTHGGILILVKLHGEACNFDKINTPPWVLFTFFKLYKWYQIAQRTTYMLNDCLYILYVKSSNSNNIKMILVSSAPLPLSIGVKTGNCGFGHIYSGNP